jgi:hypothetical protein
MSTISNTTPVDVTSLRIGDALRPVEFDVTRDVVERFAALAPGAVADRPPSILAAVYTFGVISQMSATAGAVLVGQRYRFYRNVHVGDRLITIAHVAALYVKRGRQYMELALTTRTATKELVMDARIIRILPVMLDVSEVRA